MINIGDLLAILRLRDEMSPAIDNAEQNLKQFGDVGGMTAYQLTLLGRGLREAGVLATSAFTVPITGAAAAAIKFGGDFEQVMSRTVSLAGVSADELDDVKKHILDLAPAVGIGPVALAEAMYRVSSTVSDTKVALQILDIAAKGSAAGLGETKEVATALTAIVNSYGSANITAAHAADVLTRAVRDGGAEAKQLAPLLGNVVPFAAQLGVSLEEVAANFATVTKLGVPASEAITQLTSVFAALARETPRGEAALRSVGMSYASLRQEIKEKGLAEALVHLKDAFEGNEKGLFAVVGRLEALKDIMATTGAQTETYLEEVQRMKTAQGELDKAFETATHNFKFMWQQVVVELQSVAVELGQSLLPIFKQVLELFRDDFVPVLKLLVEGFGGLPHWAQIAVLAVSGFLAILGPGLIVVGQFVLAIGNISRAFGLLTVGESSAGIAALVGFLTNPYVLAAGATLAAIAGGVLMVKGAIESQKKAESDFRERQHAEMLRNAQDMLNQANIQKVLTSSAEDLALAYNIVNHGAKEAWETSAEGMRQAAEVSEQAAIKAAADKAKVAAANQTLLDKVRELSVADRQSIDDLKARGLTITQIAKETGIAADVIGVYERQTNSAAASTKKLTADLKPFLEAWKDLDAIKAPRLEILSDIDPKIVSEIKDFLKAGASEGTLATAYSLRITQIKAIKASLDEEVASEKTAEKAIQDLQEAYKNVDVATQNWRTTVDDMNPVLVNTVKTALSNGAAMSDLAKIYNLTDTQVKAIQMSLEDDRKTMAANEAEAKKFAAAWEELNSVGADWQETLKGIDPLLVKMVQGYIKAGISVETLATAFPDLTKAQIQAIKESTKEVDTYGKAISLLATEFVKLGQIAGDSLGGILKAIGQIFVQLEYAHKVTQQIGGADGQKIGGQFGPLSVLFSQHADNMQKAAAGVAAAAAIYQGAMAVWDATGSHRTALGNAGAGALAGAQAGAAFGPWGIAIGAAAGFFVGLIRGKPEWAKAADEVGRDFGVKISEALAKQIEKDAKELFNKDRATANIYNLGSIIKEAGGLNDDNFDKFTGKLHDVFSFIERHQLTIAQGTKIIDENWQEFVRAGTDASGRLSEKLKEIIRLNEQFGTQSKEIAEYLKGQASTAVSGFNDIAAGMTEGYEDVSKAVEEAQAEVDRLKKLEEEGAEKTTLSQNKMLRAQQALTEALTLQHKAAEGAKQSLDDLGIIAIGTFAAAVASGMKFADALKAASPGLTQLKDAYEKLGIPVEDVGVKALLLQNTILKNNPALLTAIGGLASSMIALDNMGLLNVQTFEAMERTGNSLFQKLLVEATKAGGGARDALLPMQDWLHEAEKQAKLLGIPLDANTQEMIDQSKALGIWKETGKSAMETLIDAVNRLVDTLNGKLTPALERTVSVIPDNPFANWNMPGFKVPTGPDKYGYTPDYGDWDPAKGDVYGTHGPIDWNNPNLKNWLEKNPGDFERAKMIWAAEGWAGFMAGGGFGVVDRPTLFIAGEAGREEFAFSGANRTFGSSEDNGVSVTLIVEPGGIVIPGAEKNAKQLARELVPALVEEFGRFNTDGSREKLRRIVKR